jgi:hypothetical protein
LDNKNPATVKLLRIFPVVQPFFGNQPTDDAPWVFQLVTAHCENLRLHAKFVVWLVQPLVKHHLLYNKPDVWTRDTTVVPDKLERVVVSHLFGENQPSHA